MTDVHLEMCWASTVPFVSTWLIPFKSSQWTCFNRNKCSRRMYFIYFNNTLMGQLFWLVISEVAFTLKKSDNCWRPTQFTSFTRTNRQDQPHWSWTRTGFAILLSFFSSWFFVSCFSSPLTSGCCCCCRQYSINLLCHFNALNNPQHLIFNLAPSFCFSSPFIFGICRSSKAAVDFLLPPQCGEWCHHLTSKQLIPNSTASPMFTVKLNIPQWVPMGRLFPTCSSPSSEILSGESFLLPWTSWLLVLGVGLKGVRSASSSFKSGRFRSRKLNFVKTGPRVEKDEDYAKLALWWKQWRHPTVTISMWLETKHEMLQQQVSRLAAPTSTIEVTGVTS